MQDMQAHFNYPAYHIMQLCTVGATIDSESGAEAFFQELEFGSVKCGSTNTSWSSFVSVPDKSPCKVGVWFTVCLGFTWAAFLFPEMQLLISLLSVSIIMSRI